MKATNSTALPIGPIVLLVAMTGLWGVNWSVIKIGLQELPPWTFRGLCLIPGAVGLLVIARLRGLPSPPRGYAYPLPIA